MTRILRAIIPEIGTDTVLATERIIAIVAGLISPCFNSIAVLKVIFPQSFVLSSIYVLVGSPSICLVICPVPVINISINVDETAFTVGTVLTPLTAVFSTIVPSLFSETVTESSLPLTCVSGTRLECI